MRSFHMPGRSPVYARRAMCATSHPLATQAAIEIMREGGNAVDAALTAAAVLAVVEHPMTGIGGDCFAIIAKPGQKLIGLNASGRAPAAATAEWYASKGIAAIEMQSPHAVTVPGAVDGWTTLLADHGSKPLSRCGDGPGCGGARPWMESIAANKASTSCLAASQPRPSSPGGFTRRTRWRSAVCSLRIRRRAVPEHPSCRRGVPI